jgi:hypothetical protein
VTGIIKISPEGQEDRFQFNIQSSVFVHAAAKTAKN